jgi:hypothetical protein
VRLDDPDVDPDPAAGWTTRRAAAFAATVGILAAADAYPELLGSLPAFAAAWLLVTLE